jgi:hypothetical protein
MLSLQILLLILIVNIHPLHTFEFLKLSTQGCIKITRNEWKSVSCITIILQYQLLYGIRA